MTTELFTAHVASEGNNRGQNCLIMRVYYVYYRRIGDSFTFEVAFRSDLNCSSRKLGPGGSAPLVTPKFMIS
jgi:hypothetical protein